jgi:prophage tail gpP-like protein
VGSAATANGTVLNAPDVIEQNQDVISVMGHQDAKQLADGSCRRNQLKIPNKIIR